jgi:hypothetical protein
MKVIKEGAEFELLNFNGDSSQQLRFTEKLPAGGYSNGTTNEEVIDMMIERFYHLQKVRYSAENQNTIFLLKSIRRLLKKRLARKVQNVKQHNEDTEHPGT